jgi:hypothetical protein
MEPTGQTPAKKRNPVVVILIVALVLVCLCCCGVFVGLYLGGDAVLNWVKANLNIDFQGMYKSITG